MMFMNRGKEHLACDAIARREYILRGNQHFEAFIQQQKIAHEPVQIQAAAS